MKKRIMTLVYVSCGLIVLGAMITLVGFFLGGAKDWIAQEERSYRAATTFIEDSLILLPATRALNNPNDRLSFEVGDGETLLKINERYEIHNGNYSDDYVSLKDEIDSVEITCFNGDLRIKPSSTDYYRLSSSNAEDYQYYVEDGVLYLGIYPNLRPHDEANPETVTLFVPEDEYLDKFYVYFMGDNANISYTLKGDEGIFVFPSGRTFKAARLEFEKLTLQGGNKPMDIEEALATDVQVDVKSDRLSIGALKADNVKVSIASGYFYMTGSFDNLDVEAGTGSVEVTLVDSPDDYNIDIQGRTGELIIGDEDLSSIFETYSWIGNNSDRNISIKCALSKVIIRGIK